MQMIRYLLLILSFLNVLNEVSERKGLKINKSKTEVIISRAVINLRVIIRIEDNLVKQVGRFNYLGSLINEDGRCEDEIRKRINKAKCAFNKMKNLLTTAKSLWKQENDSLSVM